MSRKSLPDFNLDGYLPYQMAVAADQLSKGLARQYRDRFGISVAEWRVLVNVGYGGDVSIRDIERRVRLEKSKVSRAASRLEEAGYLTKSVDRSDRRLLKLALTDEGAGLLAQIVPIAEAYQRELIAALGPTSDALRRGLSRIINPEL